MQCLCLGPQCTWNVDKLGWVQERATNMRKSTSYRWITGKSGLIQPGKPKFISGPNISQDLCFLSYTLTFSCRKVPLLRLSFGAQLHSNTGVGLFKNSLHSWLQPEVLLKTESRRWEVSDCLTARRAFANKFLKSQTFCTLLCWLRCCFLTALEHMETLIHPTYYAEKLHALGA